MVEHSKMNHGKLLHDPFPSRGYRDSLLRQNVLQSDACSSGISLILETLKATLFLFLFNGINLFSNHVSFGPNFTHDSFGANI